MKPLRWKDVAKTHGPNVVDVESAVQVTAADLVRGEPLVFTGNGVPMTMETAVQALSGELDPDRIELDDIVNVTPIDTALVAIFTKAGKPYIPGGSGLQGWSAIKTLQRCAYEYYLSYEITRSKAAADAALAQRKDALEIGILYHLLRSMEELVVLKREAEVIDRDELREQLLDAKCAGEVVTEAYRLDDHYRVQYENDYVEPLGTEQRVQLPGDEASARYDAIVKVHPNDLVAPGTYILERKTTSRFDFASTDGWQNDGGIIGQQMIWQATKLSKKYGKLQGTIVCLVSKTKVPAFRRIIIPVQRRLHQQHAGDLAYWRAYRAMMQVTGHWPRSRNSCAGRFGPCDYFAHCAGG